MLLNLEDLRKTQVFTFPMSEVSQVKVNIVDYKKGAKYPNDICVSEMNFTFNPEAKVKVIASK